MSRRKFTSPEAFKHSLEQRLRQASTSGVDFARDRQLLVFERFLARIEATFGAAAITARVSCSRSALPRGESTRRLRRS